MSHLWLIGMMGSGKSAAGERAAAQLGVPFVDTDAEVEARIAGSIARYWELHGEDAFRDLEADAVAAAAAGAPAVVATGGGVVLSDRNVEAMRATGTVVWLVADPAELASRVAAAPGRPLLDGVDPVEALTFLLADRTDAYRRAAHMWIDTAGRSVAEVSAEVAGLWTDS